MLQPLKFPQKLAGNPSQRLQFAVSLKSAAGEQIECADPRATRAMIALMDMNAVLGGAASHYGGPAAFAELMSASHAYFFHQALWQQHRYTKKNLPLYHLCSTGAGVFH